jgi:hypothetical protein
MDRAQRLNHANHNEAVCRMIHGDGSFSDWTITTAFYTSLHFVGYFIFPITETIDEKEIKHITVEGYKKYYDSTKSKHSIISDLVFEFLPDISPDYDRLLDFCHNARYHDFRQSKKRADLAIEIMEAIKSAATKP